MDKNKSISDIAYGILKKKKEPIHHKELTKLILQVKKLGGKTPIKTINSCLCRDQRFKRIGEGRSGIYGLSEWKLDLSQIF